MSSAMSSVDSIAAAPQPLAPAAEEGIFIGSPLEWAFFVAVFIALMSFDSFCLLRGKAKLTLRQSSLYVLFYFCCAALWWLFVVCDRGLAPAFQWSTGYLLEWMLSVDNLFVYRLIFEMYKCPDYLQQKPLFVGIIGVIVLRLFLFAVGEYLYHSIGFVYLVLGAFLIYTGIKVIATDEDDDEEDPTQGRFVRWLAKQIPLVSYYDADGAFFVLVPKGIDLQVECGSPVSDCAASPNALVDRSPAPTTSQSGASSTADSSNPGNEQSRRADFAGSGAGELHSSITMKSPYSPAAARVLGKESSGTESDTIEMQQVGGVAQSAAEEDLDPDIPRKCRSLVRRFSRYKPRPGTISTQMETRCTMSFLVACCLAATDVIFAVDSASAIIAQIPDIYLAYTACAFATLGLRAMFFMVSELIALFSLLKYGVGFVLVFTGGKLMLAKLVSVPDGVTAAVMISTFLLCTLGSVFWDRLKSSGAAQGEVGKLGTGAGSEDEHMILERRNWEGSTRNAGLASNKE
ncbi:unnamed protein product [Amoebophrya sp. A25]|nr:unnamed protein product [Amoebophrya sp. A25]|eukprot:GSA25T00006230001.1